MANEISIDARMSCKNGSLQLSIVPGGRTVNQAVARGGNPGTVSVGTAEQVLTFGDLTTPGYCLMQNLDATNYVAVGPTSSGAMVAALRLLAGEYALLRLAPAAVYRAKAHTAAVNLLIVALDT